MQKIIANILVIPVCLLPIFNKSFAQAHPVLQLEVIPCCEAIIKQELKDSLRRKNERINRRYADSKYPDKPAKFNYRGLCAELDKWINDLFGSNRYLYTIQLWIYDYPYLLHQANGQLENKAPMIGTRVRDSNFKTFYTVAQLDDYFKPPKYLFTDSLIINLRFLVKPSDSLQLNTDKGTALVSNNGNGCVIKSQAFNTLQQPAWFKLMNLNNKRIATKGKLALIPDDIKAKVLNCAGGLNKVEDMDTTTKTDFVIEYAEKLLKVASAVDTDDLLRWLRSKQVNLK